MLIKILLPLIISINIFTIVKVSSFLHKQGSFLTFRFPIIAYRNDNSFFIPSIVGIIFIFLLASCSSSSNFERYDKVEGKLIESGEASWYGPNFHGKKTANGEEYNMYELTAAHKTLPFNSKIKVVNKSNGKSVIVRINDRGPFVKNRIIDLSKKAAEMIDMIDVGYTDVDLILFNEVDLPVSIKKPSYTVQVGSFKNRNDAERLSLSIDGSRIVTAHINEELYYRVYVGTFENIENAKSKKKTLNVNGFEGFVKQIEN